MTNVAIRMYQPGDEAGIIETFNSIFPSAIDQAHWQWKFAANPAGFPLIVVATQGDTIAGHLCFNPMRFLIDGKVVRAALGMDLFVSKDHQRGLGGGRMVKRMMDLVLEHNHQTGYLDFIYGVPMPHWLRFGRKVFGLETICSAPELVRLVNVAYVFRRLLDKRPELHRRVGHLGSKLIRQRRLGPTDDGQSPPVTRLTDFDTRFDRLWEETAPDHGITIIRDQRYLSWRYTPPYYVTYAVTEPDRAHGFIVLRTMKWEGWRVGYIIDLWARDCDVAQRLLRTAVAHFRRERVDLVRCWMMEHSPYHRVLRRLRFAPRPSDYKLTIMHRSLTPSIPIAPLLEPTRWYFTYGDSDGI